MCRVDDCFNHGYAFYYWICRSYVSVISFRICLYFSTLVFIIVVVNFDISLPMGDRFPCQMTLKPSVSHLA